MMSLAVKTLFLCAFVSFGAKAEAEQALKQMFIDILMKCSEEHSPVAAEVELFKEKQIFGGESIKCMFACIYKKSGMMTENGKMSVEGVIDYTKKYFGDDAEKRNKAMAYAEACRSVNDIQVSDGEKGCERAELLFKCTVEKGADFHVTQFDKKGPSK